MTDINKHQNDDTPWRSFIEVLRGRRSRRFGLGMKMESGPIAYESHHEGLPLTEEEEALLVFAACGITGYALGDLVYDRFYRPEALTDLQRNHMKHWHKAD